LNWPRYISAAARLAFDAWRDGRLSTSPRRWLLDLRHLHGLIASGHPVPVPAASGRQVERHRQGAERLPAPSSGSDAGLALTAFLASGQRLRFETAAIPKISVILVLFNRAELTLRCLRSLVESQAVPLDVVVFDNHSTDETNELLDRLDGVRIVRSLENVGFLRGCNTAVPLAGGEHLLFLNNDVELLPGSVAAALTTLETSSSAGAVGGRLILTDGRLQEAGGIVWSDGSCEGYGRGESPWAPEYAFARDVDYCSAAFLMTPRRLFVGLGGFDERFAPAYYEDVDYCVRVWASGRRVVYEPRAIAVHVEFGSSSSRSDAIRMQAERRDRFREKHAAWLQQQGRRSAESLLKSRDGGPKRPWLLYIDDRVPRAPLGSGYPRAVEIVRASTRLGYRITLYPLVVPDEPWDTAYSDVPRETELMLGLGPDRLAAFLENRTAYYEVILVSRPHNMRVVANALSTLADFDRPILVYDAEALFSLRDLGRERLIGAPSSSDRATQLIDAELALARDCDVVLTVSESERQHFVTAAFPHVLTLGNSLDVHPGTRAFEEREGFLFVGAMVDDRSPNVDSVLWFCREILPMVRRRLGANVPVTVVGRDESSTVRQLARDPSIELTGMVADLAGLFDRARVFIAPTRFGSGIPLKVQEAAAQGLPVVATSVIAGQLGWRDGEELLASDDAEEFAGRCVALYEDAKLWARIRDAALARVAEVCAPDRFQETLAEAFRAGGESRSSRAPSRARTGDAPMSEDGSRSGLTKGSR
jgi:GT2 family glycosyltransferase